MVASGVHISVFAAVTGFCTPPSTASYVFRLRLGASVALAFLNPQTNAFKKKVTAGGKCVQSFVLHFQP